MCTLGDEYTVLIVRLQYTVICPSGACVDSDFLLYNTPAACGLARHNRHLDRLCPIAILSLHCHLHQPQCCVIIVDGAVDTTAILLVGRNLPSRRLESTEATKKLRDTIEDRQTLSHHLETTNESSLLAIRRRVKACYGMSTLHVY